MNKKKQLHSGIGWSCLKTRSVKASGVSARGPAAIRDQAQPSSRQREQRERGRLGHDRDRERSPREVIIVEVLIGDYRGTWTSRRRVERVNARRSAGDRKANVRDL